MDGGVERGVGGLEAQEITVGAGCAPEAELIGQSFAEAEGDGEWGFVFDGADDFGEPCGLDAEVLAGLEDDRAEAELDCGARASENLFARHAIARHGAGDAQAAVVALANAETGNSIRPRRWMSSPTWRQRAESARAKSCCSAAGWTRATSRISSWVIRGIDDSNRIHNN